MRTLTSVQSATWIRAFLSFELTTVAFSDITTTQIFSNDNIVNITDISAEIDFEGGFGKPSVYDISLSTSLGWIKENLSRLPQAECRLNITVNSDTFQPHVGRVREIVRTTDDPNQIQLKVYDKFLDTNPLFPAESVVDTHTNTHPEVVNADLGVPSYYYGKHHRPFFHTPVDCAIDSLFGPKNVSSENHVSSVFYASTAIEGDKTADANNAVNFLMNKTWAQQSGSTNLISGGNQFEVQGLSAVSQRFWGFENGNNDRFVDVESRGQIAVAAEGIIQAFTDAYSFDNANSIYQLRVTNAPSAFKQNAVFKTNTMVFSFYVTGLNSYGAHNTTLTIGVTSGDASFLNAVGGTEQDSAALSGTVTSSLSTDYLGRMFTGDYQNYVSMATRGERGGAFNLLIGEFQFKSSLLSNQYRNYSIFSSVVNSADVAISTNPFAILDDIFSHSLSVAYKQDQSSSAQVTCQNSAMEFNCFFSERQKISDILDEFGKITATHIWVGDSGMINYRTYQESSSVTVNLTITTSDMLSFQIISNPLGTTRFKSPKSKRVAVNYDFDFMTGKYKKQINFNKSNSSLCDSADAGGIKGERIESTRYTLDPVTATVYANSLTRFSTKAEEYVQMTLPARFFQLELTDVVKVQHPMIVGSESLYQIISHSVNARTGVVSVLAEELIAL